MVDRDYITGKRYCPLPPAIDGLRKKSMIARPSATGWIVNVLLGVAIIFHYVRDRTIHNTRFTRVFLSFFLLVCFIPFFFSFFLISFCSFDFPQRKKDTGTYTLTWRISRCVIVYFLRLWFSRVTYWSDVIEVRWFSLYHLWFRFRAIEVHLQLIRRERKFCSSFMVRVIIHGAINVYERSCVHVYFFVRRVWRGFNTLEYLWQEFRGYLECSWFSFRNWFSLDTVF